jgi:hypothetical protein
MNISDRNPPRVRQARDSIHDYNPFDVHNNLNRGVEVFSLNSVFNDLPLSVSNLMSIIPSNPEVKSSREGAIIGAY